MESKNKDLEIPVILPEDEGKVKALIERIEMREITLSFSSIKAFIESPRHFISYKLREFEPTKAMVYGDLVDCLFTSPESFNERFIVVPSSCELGSIKGANAWLNLLEYIGPRPAGFEALKALVRSLIKLEKRHFVSEEMRRSAQDLADKMRKNAPFFYTLEEVTEFQRKVEFELYGWNWIGYEDMFAEGLFVADLKMCPETKERKVRNKIKDEKLILQLALYCYGESLGEGRLLFFDKMGNFRAERIRSSDMSHELTMLRKVMEKFEDCIHLEQWHQSRDFWSPNWDGFYNY